MRAEKTIDLIKYTFVLSAVEFNVEIISIIMIKTITAPHSQLFITAISPSTKWKTIKRKSQRNILF